MNLTNLTNLLIFFLFISPLSAQTLPPINSDRPDQSDSPAIVPEKTFQFETGFVYESDNLGYNDYKITTITIPDLLIRYGLLENAEISIGLKYLKEKISYDDFESGYFESRGRGFGPVTVGTKIKICEENLIRPAAAFAFNLGIPETGNPKFQTPHTALEFRLLMQNTISKRISVSYNIGETWDGFSPKPAGLYNISFGIEAAKKIGAFIEAYGYLADGEIPDHRADGGFTYLIKNNLQADVFAGIGITQISPDFYIGAGLSFRIPN